MSPSRFYFSWEILSDPSIPPRHLPSSKVPLPGSHSTICFPHHSAAYILFKLIWQFNLNGLDCQLSKERDAVLLIVGSHLASSCFPRNRPLLNVGGKLCGLEAGESFVARLCVSDSPLSRMRGEFSCLFRSK